MSPRIPTTLIFGLFGALLAPHLTSPTPARAADPITSDRTPVSRLPAADRPLHFTQPARCNTQKNRRAPKRLADFDWCAFAARRSEKWKQPNRRHDCTRADTRAEKKACRAPDAYELLGVTYADVVPASAVLRGTKASLCKGPEALLLFRVTPPGAGPRLVLQARCASSFPPDPLRAGLNGEFELPDAVTDAAWFVAPGGVVRATYPTGDGQCSLTWLPDRGRTASYGIGLTEKDCRKP